MTAGRPKTRPADDELGGLYLLWAMTKTGHPNLTDEEFCVRMLRNGAITWRKNLKGERVLLFMAREGMVMDREWRVAIEAYRAGHPDAPAMIPNDELRKEFPSLVNRPYLVQGDPMAEALSGVPDKDIYQTGRQGTEPSASDIEYVRQFLKDAKAWARRNPWLGQGMSLPRMAPKPKLGRPSKR